jgi:energy-coupling factor transporter ATP-binding protein EcfA2
MHNRSLWHNDLHDDNVLVRTVQPDENLPERYEAKLIDFGSAAHVGAMTPEHPARSDYFYLAKHVYALADRLPSAKTRLSAPDRCFISRLHQVAHRLADENVTRRNLDPRQVQTDLNKALAECSSGLRFPALAEMLSESKLSFREPLANTNALDLKPQDIPLLFRDTLNWAGHIRKSEPVLIVGPRGCGKTMLLRYYSLASAARPQKGEKSAKEIAGRLEKATEVGFIVHCSDIRNPFFRSVYQRLETESPEVAQEFCRDLINTHFALEVGRAALWLRTEKIASVGRGEYAPLEGVLSDALFGTDSPRLRLEDQVAELERRVVLLSNLPRGMKYEPSGLVNITFLESLGKALKSVRWFSQREIWFLLDDYSATVIPVFAQAACNPLLLRPSEHIRLKITSEGDGPCLHDHLNRKYKETREFIRASLGEIYFKASEEQGRKLFEDILDARFDEVGVGSLDQLKQLLGEHPNEDGFGDYMLTKKRLGDVRFHGFGLICRLCSGDVSFIIDLLGHLTDGRWDTRKMIAPVTQDKIIKNYANRRLADLRRTRGQGEALHTFAMNAGSLLRGYLERSRGRTNPDERLRMEVRGTGVLRPEAQSMHNALLRHSVLIDGGSGKDKAGAPTMKLYFCRLLAPCFPFSPLRKGCVDIDLQEYQRWLLNPDDIWKKPPDNDHLDMELLQ